MGKTTSFDFLNLTKDVNTELTFVRFAGPREDVHNILAALSLQNVAEFESGFEKTPFTCCYIYDNATVYSLMTSKKVSEAVAQYPRCEYFHNIGISDFSDYEYSLPGETTKHFCSYCETPHDYGSDFYEKLFYSENTEVVVVLQSDEQITTICKGESAFKSAKKFIKQPLTCETLYELCRLRKGSAAEKAAFQAEFTKLVPDMGAVKRVSVAKRQVEPTLYCSYQNEDRAKLQGKIVPVADKSVVSYAAAHIRSTEMRTFDYEHGVITEEKFEELYAPQDPLNGKVGYEYTELYRWPTTTLQMKV